MYAEFIPDEKEVKHTSYKDLDRKILIGNGWSEIQLKRRIESPSIDTRLDMYATADSIDTEEYDILT